MVYARNSSHEDSLFIESIPKGEFKVDDKGRRFTHGKRVLVGKDIKLSASIGAVGFGDKVGELKSDIDEHDLIRIADYVRYVVKACGKRAVLTLHDARLCDSNGVYWKRFMESHKQKS
jgi:hypothetical protein